MTRPTRHPKTGIFQFRKRVPADLKTALGKAELKKSLSTRDPAEAKRRCAEEEAAAQRLFAYHRSEVHRLSHREVLEIAGEVYSDWTASMDADPGEPVVWDALLAWLARLEDQGKAVGASLELAEAALQRRGYRVDADSLHRLAEAIHAAFKQASAANRRKALGDYSPDPAAMRFPVPSLTPSIVTSSPGGATLGGLFELWRKDHEASGGAPATVAEYRVKVDAFIAYLGHDDASRVRVPDVFGWLEKLRDEDGLKVATINAKYRTAVSSIYGAGLRRGLVTANPAKGTSLKADRDRVTRRKGYEDAEALTILQASLRPSSAWGKASDYTKAAYRWLPWLGAFTGARGGELAQLRKEDIHADGPVPFIRITPEAGTVKTGVMRDVPLHPQLLEQGFLAWVATRPPGPLFHSPAGGKPGAAAGKVRDKVGRWTRKVSGIADEAVAPTHAWRHRFKTVGRTAGIPRDALDALQGHADGSASQGYGVWEVAALGREVAKLPRYDVDTDPDADG